MSKRRADVLAVGGILMGGLLGFVISQGIASARHSDMHRHVDANVTIERHVDCSVGGDHNIVMLRSDDSRSPHVISIRGNRVTTKDGAWVAKGVASIDCETTDLAKEAASKARDEIRERFERIEVRRVEDAQRSLERALRQIELERERMEVHREDIEWVEEARLQEAAERLEMEGVRLQELEKELEFRLRGELEGLEAALEEEIERRKRRKRRGGGGN